jgi:hypothetical protein
MDKIIDTVLSYARLVGYLLGALANILRRVPTDQEELLDFQAEEEQPFDERRE